MATLSNESMRPSKLENHLHSIHKESKNKPLEYFRRLRDDFRSRKTLGQIFTKQGQKKDKGLLASYEIAKIIAKAGKPHNLGTTVILPAMSVVLSTVMNQNAQHILNDIPLSNSSVSRRIDEMSWDVEAQLVSKLQVKQFAIQLDESTLRDNEALLLAYVRFIDGDNLKEEMLFARSLETDTKGKTIFKEVVSYFDEKNITLKDIVTCAMGGTLSTLGRYRGFTAYLKMIYLKYSLYTA